MSRRHSWLSAFSGFLLLVPLASCGSSDKSSAPTTTVGGSAAPAASSGIEPAPIPLPEREKLTVTMPLALEAFSQVLLADEFGEFDKENLDLEFAIMPGNEALTALASGQADVQTGGPSAAMFNAIDSGVDVKWAASNYHPSADAKGGLWIVNEMLDENGKPDPEKIKGATIAFGSLGMAGTPPAYLVEEWLQDMGLELDDLNEQTLDGADMIIAIENGSIDGGWFLDPYWLELEDEKIATFMDVVQSDATGGYILGPSRHDKPEVIAAFMRAMIRTTRTYLDGDYHSDPETVEAIAKIVGIDVEDITRTPSLVFEQDMKVDADVAQRIQQTWMGLDVFEYDELMPVDQYIDQTAVDAALSGS